MGIDSGNHRDATTILSLGGCLLAWKALDIQENQEDEEGMTSRPNISGEMLGCAWLFGYFDGFYGLKVDRSHEIAIM